MSDIFEEADLEEDNVENPEELIDSGLKGNNLLDARRRLENILEEKRLRDELDDLLDY